MAAHRNRTGRADAARGDAVAADVACRPLANDEVEHVKWTLYEAVVWSPERQLPSYEALIEHPELARYHHGWGRVGDLGVVAELNSDRAGVAFCRLFTDDDHGHGYVDERTPELAVAVAQAHRGRAVGTRLLLALADAARDAGVARLSLSVDAGNPALRLYQRLGYRELTRDDEGVRMVVDL